MTLARALDWRQVEKLAERDPPTHNNNKQGEREERERERRKAFDSALFSNSGCVEPPIREMRTPYRGG